MHANTTLRRATIDSDDELRLDRRRLFEIPDAHGMKLTCREGCLWITLDNDLRDIVLEPGETFTGDTHRRALVYALQASRLVVRRADAVAPSRLVPIEGGRASARPVPPPACAARPLRSAAARSFR